MVSSVDTIRSHIITITTPPPMHHPEVAAMIGLSVLKPTVGIARHNFGRSVTSAPAVNARSPAALRIATRCSEASNASNACCNPTATPLEIALSFSGRLIRMIETRPCCSTVTTLIDVFPLPTRIQHDRRQRQLATAAADRPISRPTMNQPAPRLPFADLLGIRVTEATADRVVAEMEVRPD